jgi:hypothetical protein
MDSVTLHMAARRYLMERYDVLAHRYAALPNHGRAEDGYHYRPKAWRIFPRYNVVAAILEQVERLDPDRLPELSSLFDVLVRRPTRPSHRSPIPRPMRWRPKRWSRNAACFGQPCKAG